MKKLALITALALSAVAAQAEYQSMIFRTADGAEESVGLEGLKMSFADGNMMVSNNSQNLTLPLASLSSMEFSLIATGISSALAESGEVTVYSIDGICRGSFANIPAVKASLPAGTYIVAQSNGKTRKITFTK